MKKNLAVILLLAITTVFAQDEKKEKDYNKDNLGKHEFRIGALNLLSYLVLPLIEWV